MPTRASIVAACLAVVAAACVTTQTPPVDYGSDARFVPFTVDSTDNVGQGDAIAFSADGLPYLTYFGFLQELEEGQIRAPRPLGSPTLPAVGLATATSDGIWIRGAIEMLEPDLKATGISVPFGPVETPNLDLTEANGNGTAATVAGDGTVHAAWTRASGVYYGTTKLGGSSTVEEVFDLGSTVKIAGPLSRPGIALDGNGVPWIGFAAETSRGVDVHVEHLDGEKWTDEVVATLDLCNGCPSSPPVGIDEVGGAMTVVYADVANERVQAATQAGDAWDTATVADDVSGIGLSFANGEGGTATAYFTGQGSVAVAIAEGGGWSTHEVAQVADPGDAADEQPQTAVAVGADGTVYVAWPDQGIHMSTGTDTFTPVDLGHTVGTGVAPALAATEQGFGLSWYDPVGGNLLVGFYGALEDVLVANPSPSITVSFAPPVDESCGKDGKVQLDIAAQPGNLFSTECLVAPAGEAFTINYVNEDTVAHNIDVYTEQGGDSLGKTDILPGPLEDPLEMEPLDVGTYYFQCDAHPTTMTGQLAVVKGAR
jgi:plastocyanin